MKRLHLIILIFIATTGYIKSQSCSSCRVSSFNYLKYSELDKAKEQSDFCISCEKSKTDPRVWYYRGMIYQNIHTSKDFKKLDPDAADKAFEAYKSALVFNFVNPNLQKLDIINNPTDQVKFITALNDIKTKYVNSDMLVDILQNQYPALANIFVNKGVEEYQTNKNYEKAYKYFENSLFVSGMLMKIDTPVIYYCALAAQKAKKYDEAKEMFEVLIKLEYGANEKEKSGNYFFLADVYKSKDDTIKFIETLKKGIDKYPTENTALVVELINYYLSTNKSTEALNYLELATKNTPDNPTYWFAKGSLYDANLKDPVKAIECYLKAIELKPDYFEPNYNMGALYYNDGADMLNKANDIKDKKKYKEAKAKAEAKLKEALPYLEKAYQIAPTDLPTMESLKSAYYRVGMQDKSDAIKKEIDALIK